MVATKILLIEDVEDLGRKGDLTTVKPGYAYNYLIPQGFAVLAGKVALRRQVQLQEERRVRATQEKRDSEEIAVRLNGETVETTVKVDQEGHMYGSVSVLDIINLIQHKTGVAVGKKAVQLKQPIKELGVFAIPLKLQEGVVAEIHLKILPEQG